MGFKGPANELSSCMAKPKLPPHQSWLPDANHPTADFPLTHLPYGAFTTEDQQHLCVAIGTHLLDLHACAASGLLPPTLTEACQSPTLNLLMSQGQKAWTLLRKKLTALLHADASPEHREQTESALHSIVG